MAATKVNFKRIVNRLILFIGVGVACHVIFLLATTEKSMLLYLNKLNLWDILLIMLLMLFPWMAYAGRVLMWSKFLNENITYADALRVVITADLSSALSPTAVGGAPVKAALLLNRGFRPGSVGFFLTYGVIEDILFYSSGVLLALFFSGSLVFNIVQNLIAMIHSNIYIISGVMVFAVSYFYLLKTKKIPAAFRWHKLLPPRWKARIIDLRGKFITSLNEMRSNFNLAFHHGKLRIFISISVLFLQWMSKFSVLIVILHAFGVSFDLLQIYLRQWVIYVTMLFIPTPGASGGAEASFLLIFGHSIPDEITYLVVSVWRLFTYYFILISAVIFYSVLSIVLRKDEVVEIETPEKNII